MAPNDYGNPFCAARDEKHTLLVPKIESKVRMGIQATSASPDRVPADGVGAVGKEPGAVIAAGGI